MGVPLLWGSELAFIAQPSVQKGGGGRGGKRARSSKMPSCEGKQNIAATCPPGQWGILGGDK
jgi:hypothetical protein